VEQKQIKKETIIPTKDLQIGLSKEPNMLAGALWDILLLVGKALLSVKDARHKKN
jgi:hypothetical protein